jgi:hypothetical protein
VKAGVEGKTELTCSSRGCAGYVLFMRPSSEGEANTIMRGENCHPVMDDHGKVVSHGSTQHGMNRIFVMLLLGFLRGWPTQIYANE